MERPHRARSLPAALRRLLFSAFRLCLSWLPARAHAVLGYLRVHGRLPNLRDPRTFSEKIVWRKLYERDTRLPELVDKVRAKDIVAERFGAEWVIPTLAVYERAEDLDFTAPPLAEPPYVIKASHGWAMNFFVLDRSAIGGADGAAAIRRRLRGWLSTDHSSSMREWAYSRVRPRILVEPYVGVVDDYKFHVFHGRVFACELICNRFSQHRQEAIYDRDWNLIGAHYGLPLYGGPVPQPAARARMLRFAEELGGQFDYVRVDLYLVGDEPKFSEMTFYPGGGEERMRPALWDQAFGEQWRLARRRRS